MSYCSSCDVVIEKSAWCKHKCNQGHFQCDQCPFSSGRSDALKRHVLRKHPKPPDNSTNNNNNNNQSPDDQDTKAETDDRPAASNPGQGFRWKGWARLASPFAFIYAPMTILFPLMLPTLLLLTVLLCTVGWILQQQQPDPRYHLDEEWDLPQQHQQHPQQPQEQQELQQQDQDQQPHRTRRAHRARGRPRGRHTWDCQICQFPAASKKRLESHLKTHERKNPDEYFYCKYYSEKEDNSSSNNNNTSTENEKIKCRYKSKRKNDVKRHEEKCSAKPIYPKRLCADVLWDLISCYPLSNNLACEFLKKLEKLLGWNYCPPNLKKEMSDHLNSTMQYLEGEKVTFKVGHRSSI